MDITTILQILGVVGVLALLAGVLLKYSGAGELLNVIINFLHTAMNGIGRIFTLAPRGLQVLIFMFIGFGVIGGLVSWYAGTSYVCSQCQVYNGGFIESSFANALPSDAWCGPGVNPETSLGASSVYKDAGGSVVSDVRLISGAIPGNVESHKSLGTILGTTSTIGAVAAKEFSPSELLIAVPVDEDFDLSDEKYTYNVCQRSDDSCFLDREKLWRPYCGFGASKVYQFTYWFHNTDDNSLSVKIETMNTPAEVGGAGGKIDASAINSCTNRRDGSLPLVLSGYAFPATGAAGSYRFTFEDSAGLAEISPEGAGYAEMKYVSLTRLLQSTEGRWVAGQKGSGAYELESTSEGGTETRQKFIEETPSFEKTQQSNVALLSYTCEEQDKVATRVIGIDLFNIKTLAVLFVIGFLFWLLKFVGMF